MSSGCLAAALICLVDCYAGVTLEAIGPGAYADEQAPTKDPTSADDRDLRLLLNP